jgi:hypothetical protein
MNEKIFLPKSDTVSADNSGHQQTSADISGHQRTSADISFENHNFFFAFFILSVKYIIKIVSYVIYF